jgi:signal transduction histidine kinase
LHGNFCKSYRELDENNEKACLQCDEHIARKYYQGLWKTPKIYNCHIGIWDMAYPLYVDNRLIGVIFAGQIIVDDDMTVLREKLSSDFNDEFYEGACSIAGSQITNIMNHLDSKAADHDFLKDLLAKNSKDHMDMLMDNEEIFISYEALASRYRDFKEFGSMLISLISKLHKLTVLVAQMDLLNTMSSQLSRVTTCFDLWWDTLQTVVNDFRRALNLDDFEIYYRFKSDYVQIIGNEGLITPDKAKRIPLDMAVGIPVDELVHLYQISINEDLLSEFHFDRQALVYRSEVTDVENQNISTLLLVSSPINNDDNIAFTKMFCEMIAVRTNISGIFEQMIREREDYKKRVRRVSHYTKTMLHNSLSNIRQLWKNRQVNIIIREKLENIEESIKLAKLEMAELDMKASYSHKDPLDILPVIDDVVNIFTSWAEERACIIEYQKPTRPIIINMNQAEIKIAITNLLENAIKYSYAKHSVRLSVTIPDEWRVIIKIINYGIGIPEDKLKTIREEGQRGGIRDMERTNVTRTGTGLGLPIAIDFIESHSGSLHIRSIPADNNERNPYHRYVTTVTVTLPLHKERRPIQ